MHHVWTFFFSFGNVMKKITAKKQTNKVLFISTDSERDVQT